MGVIPAAVPILIRVAREQVVIASVAAPWGPIRLGATARGLVAVDQLTTAEEFSARMERRFGRAPVEAAATPTTNPAVRHLDEARRALEDFFSGDLWALGDLAVDLDDRPAWDRLVLTAVRSIPPGTRQFATSTRRVAPSRNSSRATSGRWTTSPSTSTTGRRGTGSC